jgi:hypothetical protein
VSNQSRSFPEEEFDKKSKENRARPLRFSHLSSWLKKLIFVRKMQKTGIHEA